MFTLRTHPFGFLFCDGGHDGLKFGKRKCLSILRGASGIRDFLEKVFSTAQAPKSKNRAIGQNYFVF
jgi:hypothetical protein